MTARKAKPTSVSENIEAAPDAARKKLREVRACIRKITPFRVRESIEKDRKWPT